MIAQEKKQRVAKEEKLAMLYKNSVSQHVVLDRFYMWILAGASIGLTLYWINTAKFHTAVLAEDILQN